MATSPGGIRARVMMHIEEEIEHARAGRPAVIWMKINALVDQRHYRRALPGKPRRRPHRADRARHLLPASRRPGSLGEHPREKHHRPVSRAQPHLLFRRRRNAPVRQGPMSTSARPDMMPRNLDRRVEAMVPISNPTVHEQVLGQIMAANLKDNQQSWRVLADGTCSRIIPDPGEEPFNAHEYFMTKPKSFGARRSAGPQLSAARFRGRSERHHRLSGCLGLARKNIHPGSQSSRHRRHRFQFRSASSSMRTSCAARRQ